MKSAKTDHPKGWSVFFWFCFLDKNYNRWYGLLSVFLPKFRNIMPSSEIQSEFELWKYGGLMVNGILE